jgi:caffeoyl-CoA O-methyltransferase
MNFIDKAISEYVFAYTQPETQLLQDLTKETHEKTTAPQMLTGRLEGRLLKFLVKLSGARKALEIGMFTGYSALSIAEGLPEDGTLITCEVDERVQKIAERYFAQSPHGHKIQVRMGAALGTIDALNERFDFVFIDADKQNYLNYYEATLPKLRSGGLMVIDNTLWSGDVLHPQDESARTIHKLNQRILQDQRVENILLTVRDGIQLVLKR